MAEKDRLYEALRNAHKAGDTQAATRIAEHIRGLDSTPAPKTKEPPQVTPKTPPQSFLQSSRDALYSRSTFAGAGGMVGSAVGATSGLLTGPGAVVASPAGAIAGGGLGAMIGSATFDSVEALRNWLAGTPEEGPTMGETFKSAAREGVMDAAFGTAGAVLQPLRWSKALLAKAAGVTTDAAEILTNQAKRFGIHLGAVDVGGGLPKGYSKTVGVFPWTGTPFRKQELSKHLQSNKAIGELLNTFGPNKALTDLGIDMVAAARGTNDTFRGIAGILYDEVNVAIEQAIRQDIIPTKTVRDIATGLMNQAKAGQIILENGEPLPRVAAESVTKYLENFDKLPRLITTSQFRQLKRDLSDFIGKTMKDGWDVKQLTQIAAGLEDGFNNMRLDLLPPNQGEAIQKALKTANNFYTKGIVQFQTKAAKAFERVDKNIFQSGAERLGNLNKDEVYNVAANLKSPQQIRDLTKLVGKDNMKMAASRHFEEAVTSSSQVVKMVGAPEGINIVDPYQLEKAVGLVGTSKKQLAGITELYKTAGVDIGDIKDLIQVMKRIEGISNPAEFVRRRVIMGGVTGAAAAAGVGGAVVSSGAGAGVATASAMTLLSRHFSKVFADPRKLKLMTIAMDEARQAVPRRAALARIVKMLSDEENAGKERLPAVHPVTMGAK